MAQSISLILGATSQLRSADYVQNWESDNPSVASVTNEQLDGRHGGLVTAISTGRARIRAFGENDSCVLEVEVRVEGSPTVTLGAGETAQLQSPAGGSRWSAGNDIVAEVSADGTVRGMSPGIVMAECNGSTSRISVTGTLRLEVGETAALAERFGVPVRSWQVGSSAASVDESGVLVAGDSPRRVEVTAILDGGEAFSFELQIVRSEAAAPSPVHETRQEQPEAPPTVPASIIGPDDPAAEQRRQVENHLAAAEVYAGQGNLAAAGSELTAARIVASGYDELAEAVERREARLRQSILAESAAVCAGVAALIRRGRCADASRAIETARVPNEAQQVLAALENLCGVMRSLDPGQGFAAELETRVNACLAQAWDAAVAASMPTVLPDLAQIAATHRLGAMADKIVQTLGGTTLSGNDMPVRQSLEACLKALDAEALEAVLSELAATDTGKPAGNWLLDVLVGINPGKRAAGIVSFYARQTAASQSRIAFWLSRMGNQSCPALMDLLAGVYRRSPLDARLAFAIRDQLGPDRLEKEALRLAADGHAGAQTVLKRLFGY